MFIRLDLSYMFHRHMLDAEGAQLVAFVGRSPG